MSPDDTHTSVHREFYPAVSCGEWGKYTHRIERALLVASSFAGSVMTPHTSLVSIPVPKLPDTLIDGAADWGGYRVVSDWDGNAPFTPQQYVDWLSAWHPRWAATWDYPCGDDKGADPTVVRDRQDETTLMAWFFWRHWRSVPWSWTPTVQGREVADYERHAQDLSPLIRKMHAYYQERDGEHSVFRVGIGSLVGRKLRAINAIVEAVCQVLPDVSFHAWGAMKLSVLNAPEPLHERVRSLDSSAYNGRFGQDLEAFSSREEPQRKIVFEERLPSYLGHLQAVVAAPKQYRGLFDELEETA